MKGGQHVDADFIIAATGLTMQQNFPFSTIKVNIDGQEYKAAEHLIYNAVMISDVPNFGFIIGYTNASWTLKADIGAKYLGFFLLSFPQNVRKIHYFCSVCIFFGKCV